MAPIYDTDVAEERWSKAEWERFELWEKVEVRLRKRKWIWIACTVLLFLALSSIPILVDRLPKWSTLSVARRLSQELSQLKRDAATEHRSIRLRFTSTDLKYVVEIAETCESPQWTEQRRGEMTKSGRVPTVRLLSPSEGLRFGLPGLIEQICFDPMKNFGDPVAFGLIPVQDAGVKDLTDARPDRISILMINGNSAEISFE